MAYSPKTARTWKSKKESHSSRCIVGRLVRTAVRLTKISVFSLLRKTGNDGDDRADTSRLFQIDAAAAGKAGSLMVACKIRGPTSADIQSLMCVKVRDALEI